MLVLFFKIFAAFSIGINCLLLNGNIDPSTTQMTSLSDKHYNFLLDLLAEEKQLRHQLEQTMASQQTNLQNMSKIISNQQTDIQHMSKMLLEMHTSKTESVEAVDVSKGKVATQSHTRGDGYASLAVDGILSTWSCTANDGELKPWMMIDLGVVHVVERVEIYNRIDCCGERLKSLMVYVGNTTTSYSWCAYFHGPGTDGQHVVLNCRMPMHGRYVKLMIDNDDPHSILHVNEVLIYAK